MFKNTTEIKIFSREKLVDSDLPERIIEFDKQNMAAMLEAAVLDFPEENRRKSFQHNPTLIVAFHGERIAGYIEYLRSWTDERHIYVSSLQIATEFRNSKLLLQLLDKFMNVVREETFSGFETNVQKVNGRAVELCRKLGFKLTQNPRNEASWAATAGPELLSTSPIIPLLKKWKRQAQDHNNTRN